MCGASSPGGTTFFGACGSGKALSKLSLFLFAVIRQGSHTLLCRSAQFCRARGESQRGAHERMRGSLRRTWNSRYCFQVCTRSSGMQRKTLRKI